MQPFDDIDVRNREFRRFTSGRTLAAAAMFDGTTKPISAIFNQVRLDRLRADGAVHNRHVTPVHRVDAKGLQQRFFCKPRSREDDET